jgi:Domain of unknown function (DUF4357)
VYVLYGPSTEPGRSRVYVGEGDVPRARLDQHLKEKERAVQEAAILRLKGAGGAEARGVRSGDTFAVYAGSLARAETVSSISAGYRALRDALRHDGVLVPRGSTLELTRDYAFTSPSAAAAVFLGRPANGLDEWRDADGASLKQIEAAATAGD